MTAMAAAVVAGVVAAADELAVAAAAAVGAAAEEHVQWHGGRDSSDRCDVQRMSSERCYSDFDADQQIADLPALCSYEDSKVPPSTSGRQKCWMSSGLRTFSVTAHVWFELSQFASHVQAAVNNQVEAMERAYSRGKLQSVRRWMRGGAIGRGERAQGRE